jgi:hypothetical protein
LLVGESDQKRKACPEEEEVGVAAEVDEQAQIFPGKTSP